jgi:hypothetical protein
MTESKGRPLPGGVCSTLCPPRGGARAVAGRGPGPDTQSSRSIWPLVCGALFLLLPKCPLCLAAWMAVVGVAGGAELHGWFRVGLAVAFALALTAFALNAWRWRDARPLVLALMGGAVAWTSQEAGSGGVMRSAALILLGAAAVWNTSLASRSARHSPSRISGRRAG